jgi:hypothetical protein
VIGPAGRAVKGEGARRRGFDPLPRANLPQQAGISAFITCTPTFSDTRSGHTILLLVAPRPGVAAGAQLRVIRKSARRVTGGRRHVNLAKSPALICRGVWRRKRIPLGPTQTPTG